MKNAIEGCIVCKDCYNALRNNDKPDGIETDIRLKEACENHAKNGDNHTFRTLHETNLANYTAFYRILHVKNQL